MTGVSCSCVLAQMHLRFAIRETGWLHLQIGDGALLRGPAGVLGYLLFVPLFWWIPRRWSGTFLAITSLLWALLSVGPAYAGWLLAIVAGGWVLLAVTASESHAPAARPWLPRAWAAVLLALAYGLFIVHPHPFPLPSVDRPVYFYIHWAGVGFVFIKVYHVLIDTSAGRIPRPAMGEYAAYLLFAPTLRIGPVYRVDEFVGQLHDRPVRFAAADLGPAGLRILTGLLRWGLVLVLGQWFNPVVLFGRPETLGTAELLLGLYAQTMTIYLGISGYADVAIGLGRLMGFRVPENFRYPWIATSLQDFWRRWNITFGTWLRDFLYIPLGGNRRHVFVNYVVVFGFCGLWHGLFASYVAWGISQAVGLYVNRRWTLFWKDQRDRGTGTYRWARDCGLMDSWLHGLISWLLTFNYQMLTIALFIDERHVFTHVVPTLVQRLAQCLPF